MATSAPWLVMPYIDSGIISELPRSQVQTSSLDQCCTLLRNAGQGVAGISLQ